MLENPSGNEVMGKLWNECLGMKSPIFSFDPGAILSLSLKGESLELLQGISYAGGLVKAPLKLTIDFTNALAFLSRK